MGKSRANLSERFFLREIQSKDLNAVYQLAEHLDSVNIPHDKKVLKDSIRIAKDSFSGKISDPSRRQYLFVMGGAKSGKIAGTSMIFAQHGHPEAPHVYFDVIPEERYSSTLDRHFSHTTLRLGFNYRGPSEIGALVLDPELRAYGLGKTLSFVRFLFMAMFRDRFRDLVIAELMPPLTEEGRSELWEYLGKRFTGLTYQEADKLSHDNKEFIYALFPQAPLYATILPNHVRELIGEVGPETVGARRILEATGFRYSYQIDPFDGGPHFECPTDEVSLIKDAGTYTVSEQYLQENLERTLFEGIKPEGVARYLVGTGHQEGSCRFRALAAAGQITREGLMMTQEAVEVLKVKPGATIWATPF